MCGFDMINFEFKQQLYKKGSVTADLPPWAGIDIRDDNKVKENHIEQEKQGFTSADEQTSVENEAKEIEQMEISSEDLMYSNVEVGEGPGTSQQKPCIEERTVSPGGEEIVYEIVTSAEPGPSQLVPPPKPLPYSASKKAKSAASGAGDGGKLGEAEKVWTSMLI